MKTLENNNFRKYNWLSSANPENQVALEFLDRRMNAFYSLPELRDGYDLLLERKGKAIAPEGAEMAFLDWAQNQDFSKVLEVGCGLGWMYNWLRGIRKEINYTGVEISEKLTAINKTQWPEAEWLSSSVYDLPLTNESFDLVYSFYVLEHLVFPIKGLEKMLSLLKPGGRMVLIFPDFISKKNFPSQKLGFGIERTAKEKIKSGRFMDALLSILDSRIILPFKLNQIKRKPGNFNINIKPLCLEAKPNELWPDADAVYLANKVEIEHWAKAHQLSVSYPFSKNGFFSDHAFMVIAKEQVSEIL